MKTIREIRHANFLLLLETFKEAVRMEHPDAPDRGMLQEFAAVCNPTDPAREARHLSHLKNDRYAIGGQVARKLETAFGKREGWMDQPQGPDAPASRDEARAMIALLRIYRLDPERVRDFIVDYTARLPDRSDKSNDE